MGQKEKILTVIAAISFLFFFLIAFDLTPYLRGPGPYPPNWQWPYFFVNTISRIWAPIVMTLLIILFFAYLDRLREDSLKRKENFFLLILMLLCFLFQLSVLFFSRSGIFVLLHRIINPDLNGYFTASLTIPDIFIFLKNYNDNVLNLPMHAKGHPPGAIFFFFMVNKISLLFPFLFPLIEKLNPSHLDTRLVWNGLLPSEKLGALISTVLIPFLSSFIIVPLYFLGKNLYGMKTSLKSIFLYIFIPSVILFIPINDVFLALFPLTSFWIFIKGLRENKKLYLFISGLIFFSGIFFSLSLLPLIIIFLALFVSELSLNIKNLSKLIFLVLGFLLTPTLLFIFLNFNFFQISKTLMAGLPPSRPYFVWIFYNLYDFFIFAGVPILITFFIMLKKYRDALFLGFVLMLFLLNFSGSVRGEVGRIWLPFIPILVLTVSNFFVKDLKFSTKNFLIILLLQSIQILFMQEFWVALW